MTDPIALALERNAAALAKARAKREAARLAKMPKERTKPVPPRRDPVSYLKPYDFEKAKCAYQDGMPLAECATHVGVGTNRLRADFVAAGVPIRSLGGQRRKSVFVTGEGWR